MVKKRIAAKSPKKSLQTRERRVPEPGSDEFAYMVGAYAWSEGLTANMIVRRLGLEATPKHLMQVKRALSRAHQRRFLKLDPLLDNRLHEELSNRINKGDRQAIRFYVVEDSFGPIDGPVYAKGANLVSEIIAHELPRKAKEDPPTQPGVGNTTLPDVVICNAGGRTVSKMQRALQRVHPLLDEADDDSRNLKQRLLFVAANAYYHPEQFHRCANFLAVTMSELYGARHFALPKVEDAKLRDRHQELISNASLFVTGAGTRVHGLMAQYFRDRGWPFPAEAVGDLAFNVLDRKGRPVTLPAEARHLLDQLNPNLDLHSLIQIAQSGRVVLILDSDNPEEKTDISIAALKSGYATDVVLGTRLAQAILRQRF